MEKMNPYLMFDGNCEAAINFYKDIFDGEIGYFGRFSESPNEVTDSDKNKIMHVEFKFWGGSILASDHVESAGYTTKSEGSNIHLSLGFNSEGKMEETFNKLKQGGDVTMNIKEQFWGSKFGMLTDKFGIRWMFSCQQSSKS
jgi:PhnB protein